MLDCISVENMRLSDAETIDKYVPSLELMRRAANGVFQAVCWHGRVAIVAGSGNNGGDGFALACILRRHNIECRVFTLSQRLSQDSAYYAAQAETAGVPIQPFQPSCLNNFDIVVDCLLGTGFQGALRDNYRSAIEAINASPAQVVSVDINSGMNGDTGEAELAVRSDLTVTIGFVKNGLLTDHAPAHMKRLVCTDIGIRLTREENKICDETQWHVLCASNGIPVEQGKAELGGTVYYRCPEWLDMTVIKAFSQ
ncbi:MAG: NAD(P)H-hydrate epimerase [Oscillospiraceae bacterium]|nr:NAD(P)H-hydrate epimerase [Oscillospiraceae bacterium]